MGSEGAGADAIWVVEGSAVGLAEILFQLVVPDGGVAAGEQGEDGSG